jgi:D-amino-acid dehydrogenase
LGARFESLGGVRLQGEATAIARCEGGVKVRLADGDAVDGNIAVVAGGAASAPLLRPHGHRVPLIAERGYHIQAHVGDAEWPADMPPVVFEDRSMSVTRFRSALRAASFVEFAAADLPPDPRKWARLRKHAAALGLPIGPDASEWMGARPTLPDYLPAIGRSAAAPEILYAFGHQHLGLTLAACTGEAIGAIAAGEAPPFDLAPFDLARFG